MHQMLVAAAQQSAIDVWLTRIAAGATIAATLVAIVAIVYVNLQWQEAKKNRAEALEIRNEQTRPYVSIDFTHPSHDIGIIDFTVANTGSTPAFDIRFIFDPPLQGVSHPRRRPIEDNRIFTSGIPMMAPGKRISFLYAVAHELVSANLPLTYLVNIKFKDSRGESYSDRAILDLEHLMDAVFVNDKTIYHVADELKKIRQIFDRANGGNRNGLRVFVTDYEKMKQEEAEHYRKRQEQLDTVSQQSPPPPSPPGAGTTP